MSDRRTQVVDSTPPRIGYVRQPVLDYGVSLRPWLQLLAQEVSANTCSLFHTNAHGYPLANEANWLDAVQDGSGSTHAPEHDVFFLHWPQRIACHVHAVFHDSVDNSYDSIPVVFLVVVHLLMTSDMYTVSIN